MRHPLLYPKKNLFFYFIVWIPIISIHTIILVSVFHLDVHASLTDALISDALFAILALSFWYTVRFISIDTKHTKLVVFNHLMAALFFLVLWQLISGLFLRHLITGNSYQSFLYSSIPLRTLIGLFFYCIIVLAFYLYKYYASFRMRIMREADWNMLVKEGELALLKSQLQPHFIFNSLNSIHALMLSDPERAQQMLLNLASFLRLSMNKDQAKLVSLHEEIENSSLYSDIEKIRFGDRLIILTNIDHAAWACLVPHQILQPVIENAIKHGLHQHTGNVTIIIEGIVKDQKLHLSISNNHDSEEPKQQGNGIGLKHVRRRFFLLYGRKDLVHITDENGIFKIELIIPYRLAD